MATIKKINKKGIIMKFYAGFIIMGLVLILFLHKLYMQIEQLINEKK